MTHRIPWLLSFGFSLVIAAQAAWAAETSNTIQFVAPCDGSLAGLDSVAIRLRLFPDEIQSFTYEETQQLNADIDGCLSTPGSVSGSTILVGNGTPAGIPAGVFASNPSMWIAFALDSAPDIELGGGRVPVSSSGYAFNAVNANNAQSAQNAVNAANAQNAVNAQTAVNATNAQNAVNAQNAQTAVSANLATLADSFRPGASVAGSQLGPSLRLTNTLGDGLAVTGTSSAIVGTATAGTGTGGLFKNTAAGGDILQGWNNGPTAAFRLLNDGGAYFNGSIGIGANRDANFRLLLNGPLGFTNATSPMMYVNQSGIGNPGRPVIAHSPAFPNWGLSYNSQGNKMVFQTGGLPVMNVDLNNERVSIGRTESDAKFSIVTTTTSTGNNTAVFSAPNIGPGLSHIHHGTNGDWYIRSAKPVGKVVLQDLGGNVGIGTAAPGEKVDVVGNIRISNMGSLLGAGRLHIQSTENLYLNPSSGTTFVGGAGGPGNLVVAGQTTTRVLQITGGADLSEQFAVSGYSNSDTPSVTGDVEPGMVVAIDPSRPGQLVVSSQAYDRRVAGIISGAGGIKPGMLMSQLGSVADGEQPVALSGRVYGRADASHGSIEPGDLLTTSDLRGHAMRVADAARAQGAIIGKAMTGLKEGQGLVLILVTLQ